MCSTHHRMIHEERLSTQISEGKIEFIDQRGRKLPRVPPSAATASSGALLVAYAGEVDGTQVAPSGVVEPLRRESLEDPQLD